MPWRAPWVACGPALPRGTTLEENSAALTPTIDADRSTRTQWKKSTRGSDAGIVRPSLFTSSPRLGTSGSWQMIANDFVPMGTLRHESCGFWFFESVTRLLGSGVRSRRGSSRFHAAGSRDASSHQLAPLPRGWVVIKPRSPE